MIELTSENFDTTVQGAKYAVIDFWASWCGPCRKMAPILEQLSEEFDGVVDFYGVNVDEQPALASRFQISGIPNFVLMRNGEPVSSLVGARSKQDFSAAIKQVFSI